MAAALAAGALLGTLSLGAAPARAAEPLSLAISPTEAKVGDRVIVRLAGWTSTAVTLDICGNLALRGAPDCDLIRGQGIGLTGTGPTLAELKISAPPVGCPCVVRASSITNDEVQTAPLVLVGVPVAPVKGPGTPTPLVALSARVSDERDGLAGTLRPLLGGRRNVVVAVTLRNISSGPLSKVSLALAVGRRADGAEAVPVPPVSPLQPGESRVVEVRATRSAPTWGRYLWEVSADGAGPEVRTTVRTTATPWLLYLLVVTLLADLGVIAVRKHGRRRAGRHPRSGVGQRLAR